DAEAVSGRSASGQRALTRLIRVSPSTPRPPPSTRTGARKHRSARRRPGPLPNVDAHIGRTSVEALPLELQVIPRPTQLAQLVVPVVSGVEGRCVLVYVAAHPRQG